MERRMNGPLLATRRISQSVLSFMQAAPVAKVSSGFTRDLQALAGHLVGLPGRLQALAAVDNLSRPDPGYSKP